MSKALSLLFILSALAASPAVAQTIAPQPIPTVVTAASAAGPTHAAIPVNDEGQPTETQWQADVARSFQDKIANASPAMLANDFAAVAADVAPGAKCLNSECSAQLTWGFSPVNVSAAFGRGVALGYTGGIDA